MREFRYVVADVSTDTPLAGNPVAVFTDARQLEPDEMQRLAKELNLSETVFVLPAEQGGHAPIIVATGAWIGAWTGARRTACSAGCTSGVARRP